MGFNRIFKIILSMFVFVHVVICGQGASVQPFKFCDKELDLMHGLYAYDFAARTYNPIVPTFDRPDPLADKMPWLSPYAYCLDNPVYYVDPDGKDATVFIEDNTITIKVNIFIYGEGATSAIANIMQNDIMKYWGTNNNETWKYYDTERNIEYAVIFDVTVDIYDNDNPQDAPGLFSNRFNPFNRDNFIEIKNVGRSYVIGGDEGIWRSNGRTGKSIDLDDPAVHEFGHLLGFDDKYSDLLGIQKGWEGNVMAEPTMKGKVEQRDINSLVRPIINKYNKRLTQNVTKYKTSINYSKMQY